MSGHDQKLRLLAIEIEGFRGINRPLRLEFGDRATLLLAPNGQGKTSVLAAIEWSLFGKLAFQIKENITNDEVVNVNHHSGETSVRLTLQRGAERYVVERRRRLGKRDISLRVTKPDGEVDEGLAADSYLYRLLGLTFDDFYRACYLHQDSIRGLLVDEPRVRDEALDRLFGLDRLRSILAAIQLKPVTDAIEKVRDQQRRAYDKLSGAAQQLEQQRQRHLQEAQALGWQEPALTLDRGLTQAGELIKSLIDFSNTFGFARPEIAEAGTVDDLERVARKAKEVIREYRLNPTNAPSSVDANRNLGDLERMAQTLESTVTSKARSSEAVDVHRQTHGDDRSLVDRRLELTAQEHAAHRAVNDLETSTRLIGDALEVLKAHSDIRSCPVCGQPVVAHSLLDSLESRMGTAGLAEHTRLLGALELVDAELNVLGQVERERARLRDAHSYALQAEQAALEEARRMSPGLEAGFAGLAELKHQIGRVRADVEQALSVDQNRGQKLDDIEQSVDRLRALHKIVKDDQDLSVLRVTAGTEGDAEEDEELSEELSRLISLQESMQMIAAAIQDVARQRSHQAIESSRPSMVEFYSLLCNHPYFDRLRIDAQDKMQLGVAKNTYIIRAYSTSDGTATLAGSRLSTAQMNCLALSIYLALTEVMSHHLGFIILDDPSQSLDGAHKLALAKVLAGILTRTQMVISTQDLEFEQLLIEVLGQDGVKRNRLAWTPQAGTSTSAA